MGNSALFRVSGTSVAAGDGATALADEGRCTALGHGATATAAGATAAGYSASATTASATAVGVGAAATAAYALAIGCDAATDTANRCDIGKGGLGQLRFWSGTLVSKSSSQAYEGTAVTLTAAQLVDGLVLYDPQTSSQLAVTMPAAGAVIALLSGAGGASTAVGLLVPLCLACGANGQMTIEQDDDDPIEYLGSAGVLPGDAVALQIHVTASDHVVVF